MTYLLWTIANLCLFLFFIYTCLRATKHIRKDMGLLAAIIFVFGSFSFICQNNSRSSTQELSHSDVTTTFTPDSVLNNKGVQYKEINLENSISLSLRMNVAYGTAKSSGQIIPVKAYTNVAGFDGGLLWKCTALTITPTADPHKFNYQVVGFMEWNLLKYTFYNQGKSYSGTITL